MLRNALLISLLACSSLLWAQSSNEERIRLIREYNDAADPILNDIRNISFTIISRVSDNGQQLTFTKNFGSFVAEDQGGTLHLEWDELFNERTNYISMKVHVTATIPVHSISQIGYTITNWETPRGPESEYKKYLMLTLLIGEKQVANIRRVTYKDVNGSWQATETIDKMYDGISIPYMNYDCNNCKPGDLIDKIGNDFYRIMRYYKNTN